MRPCIFSAKHIPMSTDSKREHRIRVKVFVDFWNFQLSINNLHTEFRVDWQQLGNVLAREALSIVDTTALVAYQGMNVYGSYDPTNKKDERLRRWAQNTLNTFPGLDVVLLPRQRRKKRPSCPSCHEEVLCCPKCQADMRGTEEKGVDTRIATDMIKLAWVNSYEVAVLLSSDRDFVPVVEFLSTRGIKTIHGAFLNQGAQLTQTCWGNIQIHRIMEKFRRT